MNLTALEDILHFAREHAACMMSDLELAATREEHVRLTARTNEAENLVTHLESLHLEILTAK
jgi:phosphotransferase system HPr-like phosphotransfer protein